MFDRINVVRSATQRVPCSLAAPWPPSICYQGGSHAKWPKDKETASSAGSVF
jgi:hypothetical protein